MPKNYYEIMGLTQNASEKEIKQAYRKLARKYHPDLNKTPDAEARFKEMGEAYAVLADPKKRKEYDAFLRYGAAQAANQETAWHTTGAHDFEAGGFDSDLFESLFGYARQARAAQPKPPDFHGKVTISLQHAFHGTDTMIQVPTASGTQTLKVKIPAGVMPDQSIRVASRAGDIYLTIHIDKDPLFDLVDHDLYLTLPVSPWEAALGGTIQVPTMAGPIDLKIPANSQGGQKLRLKGRGMPGKIPGDQYVILKIVTPPAHTEAEKDSYRQLAKRIPFNPRSHWGYST